MTKKYYVIIIITLIALNVFSWRIWWTHPPGNQPFFEEMMKRKRGGKELDVGMRFFSEKLQLDEKQKQGFDQLRKEYFEEMNSINESLKKLRSKLSIKMMQEVPKENLDSLFEAMARHKLQHEIATFKHFSEMRKLCDEEQKVMFDTIFSHMIKRTHKFEEHGHPGRKFRERDMKKRSNSPEED